MLVDRVGAIAFSLESQKRYGWNGIVKGYKPTRPLAIYQGAW